MVRLTSRPQRACPASRFVTLMGPRSPMAHGCFSLQRPSDKFRVQISQRSRFCIPLHFIPIPPKRDLFFPQAYCGSVSWDNRKPIAVIYGNFLDDSSAKIFAAVRFPLSAPPNSFKKSSGAVKVGGFIPSIVCWQLSTPEGPISRLVFVDGKRPASFYKFSVPNSCQRTKQYIRA